MRLPQVVAAQACCSQGREQGSQPEGRNVVTTRDRWVLIATIGFPITALSVYLIWIWPRPREASMLAELGPYALSLLLGLPFAWIIGRDRGRFRIALLYLVVGFVVLWWYAAAVLCVVHEVCL